MPQPLRDALAQALSGVPREDLMRDAQAISARYRTQCASGERLVSREPEAEAYAASRMPATFGAVFFALKRTLECVAARPTTMMDAGAGTGAAAWAADSLLALDSVLCLEREAAMRRLGEKLMVMGSQALRGAVWASRDLNRELVPERAGLVTMAYVLNEMVQQARKAVVLKVWDAAESLLLLVEPGTPKGYACLMEAREMLLLRGAHVAAPCPHESRCALAEGDWCHFSCRVQRTRLHRTLKGGEAPFEDEKFAYMAFSREPCRPAAGRILRHPQAHTGHMMVTVCAWDGIRRETVSKKDGALYRRLRESVIGDAVDMESGQDVPVAVDREI